VLRHYRLSGLTIATDLEFPGGIPVPGGGHDAVARLDTLPAELENPTGQDLFWSVDERNFLFALPDIGRFMARDGRELLMQPAEGMTAANALPFLLGTTFAALMYQRGATLLHASAVVRDGGAFAFAGHSGIGKSTLAAALGQLGGAFACDDILALTVDGTGPVRVHPDGRRLKLYASSIAALDLGDRQGLAVRSGLKKYYVEPGAAVAGEPRLEAVYVLVETIPMRPAGITRLGPVDTAQALMLYTYRHRLAQAVLGQARYARQLADLVRRVPVYLLVRPRGLDRLGETLEMLKDHWSCQKS
jgi:hypothetical protein